MRDRFVGCMLGVACGDALGAPYEGGPLEQIAWKLLSVGRDLRWTDDTEMTLVLAESLADRGRVDPDDLARRWAREAGRTRGYGPGAWRLLAMIRDGADWRVANRAVFPDGSFGNGAAMRSAPIGLCFGEPDGPATLAASITHAHPLGIEGAVLIARAVRGLPLEPRAPEYRERLDAARDLSMPPREVVRRLGNRVVAHESVVTAIHAANRFSDFEEMMAFIISLGGDVDTIGAMAGGIFGARHGAAALPDLPLEQRDRIVRAAEALYSNFGSSFE